MESILGIVAQVFAALISAGFVLKLVWGVLCYLIGLYPKYYMFKEADIKPWLAFVPFIGDAMMLPLIGVNPLWYILIFACGYIPAVGFILSFAANAVINWFVAVRFGLNELGRILSLFIGGLMHWYIALTNKQYHK